jgi:hypothetical protein
MLKRIFHRYYHLFMTILFVVAVILSIGNFNCNHDGFRSSVITNNLIEDQPSINEDLPFKDYKHIQDSLDKINQVQKMKLIGTGEELGIGPVGIRKISECDTCNSFETKGKETDKYFIELPKYELKDGGIFSIINGKYFLKHVVWDEITSDFRNGHYEKKQIPIRYAYNADDKEDKGSVLIPVTSSFYTFIKVVLVIFEIGFVLISLYCFILAVRILYLITAGDAFTQENIKGIFFIGWLLTGFGLGGPVFSLFFNLILKSKIPSEMAFYFWDALLQNRPILIAGVVVLLLASAFKRGHKLQQEQDLTI